MRALTVAAALMLAACWCSKRGGAAKVGKAEPGHTRIECKKGHAVVDDPSKCPD